MDGQTPTVHIVGFLTQEIEKLAVAHGDQEVEGVVRIAHDEKQRRLFVAQFVQLQLVVGRQLPQFLDVEGGQPSAAGDQNGFCRLARRQLVLFVLPDGKVIRLFRFQLLEQKIDVIFEILVVLMDLHRVYHLYQRGKALFFLVMPLVVDVADERGVEQGFGFHPKIVPVFRVAGGVGDQGRDQLQNVLFAVDIGEGVVVHGFFEVDRVEDADFVALPQQEITALHGDAALWVRNDKRAGKGLRSALHEVWFEPEAGLAAAGTADDQHVLVPGRPGVLRAAVHRQVLCLCQYDVVGKDGIDVGRDVLRCSP